MSSLFNSNCHGPVLTNDHFPEGTEGTGGGSRWEGSRAGDRGIWEIEGVEGGVYPRAGFDLEKMFFPDHSWPLRTVE